MHNPLMLPDGPLVLYEKIFLDSDNYKGNFKFCFTDSGDFYYQKNQRFYPQEEGYYDEDFPSEPKIRLSERLGHDLIAIIDGFNSQALEDEYGVQSMEMERWTFYKRDTIVKQSVVWGGSRPESLQELKDQLDHLITAQRGDKD